MSVKNVKVRLNLSKENDRKAYEYLQNAEVSYSKAVISAICGYVELSKTKADEEAFLERVISTIREETAKVAYYNWCNSLLHKHPPKRKARQNPKKQCSIFLTASKVSLIPAFDGPVMAIQKRIVPTIPNGFTILQY